jgi:CheY-like chemotaxis protein
MARVLVVDDEAMVREALGKTLERDGHQVDQAENGQEALERYRENRADVVVADLFMPVMDGLEFISELQKEDPDAKIVAISGSVYRGEPRFLQIAGRMGSVRTLVKPVTPEELTAVVRELLTMESENADG